MKRCFPELDGIGELLEGRAVRAGEFELSKSFAMSLEISANTVRSMIQQIVYVDWRRMIVKITSFLIFWGQSPARHYTRSLANAY